MAFRHLGFGHGRALSTEMNFGPLSLPHFVEKRAMRYGVDPRQRVGIFDVGVAGPMNLEKGELQQVLGESTVSAHAQQVVE